MKYVLATLAVILLIAAGPSNPTYDLWRPAETQKILGRSVATTGIDTFTTTARKFFVGKWTNVRLLTVLDSVAGHSDTMAITIQMRQAVGTDTNNWGAWADIRAKDTMGWLAGTLGTDTTLVDTTMFELAAQAYDEWYQIRLITDTVDVYDTLFIKEVRWYVR